MSLRKSFFLLGAWVAILPNLGFPNGMRNILMVITGIGIIVLSYSIKNKNNSETNQK